MKNWVKDLHEKQAGSLRAFGLFFYNEKSFPDVKKPIDKSMDPYYNKHMNKQAYVYKRGIQKGEPI